MANYEMRGQSPSAGDASGTDHRDFESLRTAVRENPDDERAWEQLEQVAVDAQRPEDASAVYREVLRSNVPGDAVPTLGQRALQFHEEWFGEDSQWLTDVLARVMERDASVAEDAFQRLTMSLTAAERWDELLGLYDHAVQHAPSDARRAQLLEEATQSAKDFAGHHDRAIGYLEQLLALRPQDAQLVTSLERLLERQGRWQDLIELWRGRLDRLSPSEARATRLRIARLQFEQVGSPAEALAEVRPLLAEPGAQTDEAVGLLEEMAGADHVGIGTRRDAVGLLKERYDADDRAADVVRVLQAGLEFAEGSEAVALHREAAERLAQQGRDAEAMSHYGELLRLDPGSGEAREQLRALANRIGEHERLVGALETAAEVARDTAQRASLRIEAADVRDTTLGDVQGAIQVHASVLEEPSLDSQSSLTVARRLAGLYARSGHDAERLAMLERLATLEPEAADQRAALGDAARLAEQLGQVDRALSAWERRLEMDAADGEALGALVTLLEREQRWDKLVDTLRRRAYSGVPAWQQRADLARIAAVQEQHLEDADGAIATWREIGQTYGEDSEVVDALDRLFNATRRWEELVQLLERSTEDEGAHLAKVRARLGDTYRDHLGDAHQALAAYRRALQADPRHEGAIAGLRALAETDQVRIEAVDALATAYEATDDWQGLLSALEPRLEAAPDVRRQIYLLRDAARMQEQRAEDPEAALESIARALALAPTDVGLEEEVVRLAEASGSYTRGADALGEAATQLADDPRRVAELRHREGEIREFRIGEPGDALSAYVSALRADPGRITSAEAVARAAGAANQPDVAEQALAAAVEQRPASEPHLRLLVDARRQQPGRALYDAWIALAEVVEADLDPLREAAELALDTLGDIECARAALEELYGEAMRMRRRGGEARGRSTPDECARWALDYLIQLHERDGSYARVVELLVEGASLTDEETSRQQRRRAAQLAVEQLGDRARAIELLRDLLAERPGDGAAMDTLALLYEAEGRIAEMLSLRAHELSLTDDPERRLTLRLEIARLFRELEARSGRVEVLRQNLAERPGHLASMQALEDVLSGQGRYAELADVFSEQAAALEQAGETERASSVWLDVASLAERHLQDVERAIDALRRSAGLETRADTLDALARIHRERGDAGQAAYWLERRLQMAGPEDYGAVALQLARTLLDTGKARRAIEVLEHARQADPADAQVRELLASQYRALEEWQPLAELLSDATAHVDERETLLALAREASDLYDHLGTPSAAQEVLRRAVEAAPEDRELKSMWADALAAAGELSQAREVLEGVMAEFGRRRSSERAQVHHKLAHVARAQGDLENAIQQLEQGTRMDMGNVPMLQALGQLAHEAGELDRAERAYRSLLLVVRRATPDQPVSVGASEVQWELHIIAQARGEEDQARELRESALETAAQSDAEAHGLKEALVQRGEPELALRGLEQRLEAATEPESRAQTLGDMADVLDRALGRAEEALDKRLEGLREAPADPKLHDGTRELARRLGRMQSYTEVLEQQLEQQRRREDAPVAAELLLRLGEIAERDHDDPDRAAELYRRAEGTGVRLAEAWNALARVASVRGQRDEQARVLAKLVDAEDATSETCTDALYRLAGVQLSTPDDRPQGVASLRRALERDPQYERAAAMLSAAARAAPEDESLGMLYGEVARSSGEEGIRLEYLAYRAEQQDATLAELCEAIRLAGTFGREDRAEEFVRRAREIAEASDTTSELRDVLTELADRRRESGDPAGAMKWMREAVSTASNDEEAFDLQLRLAEMASGEGGDRELAAETYESLLERDPTEPRIWQPLLRIHRETGNEDRLNDLASATLDALLDPSWRNVVRMEQAQFLVEQANRVSDAIDVLKRVLDEEPGHREGGELLAEVYRQAGYDEELVELLERQLDVARDNDDKEAIASLSLRLGGLLERVRRDDAIELYRNATQHAPENRQLVEALLALLGPDDDARLHAEANERLLALQQGEQASELSKQVYRQWQELGDEPGMQRALELGYRGCPDDESIRTQLEQWYREQEQHEALASFLAAEAGRTIDHDREHALQRVREAATIRRDQLGDPSGAADALRQARDSAPDDLGLLGELTQSLTAAGDGQAAVDEVSSSLESHPTQDDTRVELLRMRAALARHLERPDAALPDLDEAYRIGGNAVISDLIQALAERRGQAASTGDRDSERSATLRLVRVLYDAGDAAQARDLLAEWAQGAPDDREALLQLKDMERAAGNWEGVVDAAQRLVGIEEGEAQAAAALELAEAAASAGRPEAAREGLERAYRAQPEHAQLGERLRGLYETIEAHAELAQMLLQQAESAEGDERFRLLRRAGHLLVEAGDADRGLQALEEASQLKPDDHQTVVYLADAYMASERYQDAANMLQQAIENHPRRRSPELGQLQHRMAILARMNGDRQLELQWLNAGLESDKNNGHLAAELAELAMELGEQDTALNALRAITLMKGEGPMSRARAFLLQAKIAHERGESRRALLWARKAKSEDPELEEAQEFLREMGE